ncbi:hypothetical protein GCM10023068_12080 [Leifsonia shinshuensis]
MGSVLERNVENTMRGFALIWGLRVRVTLGATQSPGGAATTETLRGPGDGSTTVR